MERSGALLIGYDFSDTDDDVLIISRRTPKNETEVINAFQGKEARDIYNMLTTIRSK